MQSLMVGAERWSESVREKKKESRRLMLKEC